MSDVLPTIIGIVLIACAAAFALLPLARGERAAAVMPESLSTDRSAIYRQVLELEFDYQLGKLSTEDYQQIAADLLGQAGDMMREERGGPMAELDDEIEREIAAARAAFTAARKSGRGRAFEAHREQLGSMKRVALLIVLGALLLSPSVVLADPKDGVVSGQVVNQTGGGSSTAGANVLLVAFGRKEQAPLGQQTTTADADGRFSFTELDRDPNVVYLLVSRYGGVNYPNDEPFQLQDQANHQADIEVYDSTSADDAIQMERLNLLVMGAEQGTLQLMQMGALVNNSDRTFVTANPQDQQLARAIKFPLPPGALGVQMQSGFNQQDVIPGVGGVQVTTPILPGRHEFAMSFQVPYSGSSADLSVQVPYPTSTFSVYLPNTGLRLDTNGLTAGGPATLGGQSYALYSAQNLAKATMVPSRLSGLGGGPGGLGSTQLALISLGVVLFVLGGGVLLFGWRSRPSMATFDAPERDLEQERLELVVRLASLDERFAAGQVAKNEYEQERMRGKRRLRELILIQRQESLSS